MPKSPSSSPLWGGLQPAAAFGPPRLKLAARPRSARRAGRRRGLTLIELIVAFSIVALLSMLAVPLAQYRVRREKETDLRRALREMRTAIDKYKDACDFKVIPPGKIDSDCYPESLEQLVEGVRPNGSPDKKLRFLRRIPRDPMTNSFEWGLRSDRDDPDSTSWGSQNVYDVYTKTQDKARDGTPYSEW